MNRPANGRTSSYRRHDSASLQEFTPGLRRLTALTRKMCVVVATLPKSKGVGLRIPDFALVSSLAARIKNGVPPRVVNRLFRGLLTALGVTLIGNSSATYAFDMIELTDPFNTLGQQTTPPSARSTAEDSILSLDDAVQLALANNPRVASAWAAVRIQGAGLGLAESAFLPTLSAQIQFGRSDTGQVLPGGLSISEQAAASAALNYLLYDFGARRATRDAAQETLNAANSSLSTALQDLFLDVARAYFTLAGTDAAVAAAIASEKAAAESLSAAQTRYDAGAGTPADRLQAQTAHSQAVLNRIKAQGDQRNARGTLANLLGLEPGYPLRLAEAEPAVPSPYATQAVERLIAMALNQRPDLAASDARVRAAQAQIDASRATGLPTISLGANVGATHSWQQLAEFYSNSIGVTISIPIFTGYQSTYQVAQAKAQKQQRLADRAQLAQSISLQVWNAYQDLVTQDRALATAIDLLASAEQSERVALGRYKAGIGNILDVLSAQSALASARQQDVLARYQLALAKVALIHSLGGLELATFAKSGR